MLDQKNRERILTLLEKDARLSAKDIAVLLDLKEKDITAEIKKMEDEHIICGYHAFINWDKTDDDKISPLIELKVTPQRGNGFDKIAEKIYQYPEVEALYLMSGRYDFAVLLKKATMKEISHFVSSKLAVIDEVQSTATHFVLVRYKDHGLSLVERKKSKRMVVTP
ncbi:MAG: Lrp/AsnC family transcriptional regulator [Synergistaceae bacterium]|nr:Lrp/AsnC family transcriptional regulator [Synergistaceae bacterium]